MATRVSLNISVSPELESFISARVESGRYQSASEVVRDGLRLLEERELANEKIRRELNAKIDSGLEQIKRGEVHEGKQVFEEIRERSRKRRAKTR